ncbi:MAG: nucleotidyltransferase family protein [Bacteroidetes bacterium]|nr:nucleotidyltransferase family protein [Bacteroidota bacterium]
MKAFLLAAGLGTRLQPITLTTPKCLVPICGKPLLYWWIQLFRKHNIDKVLINLHHLSTQVKGYIENNIEDIEFVFFDEKKLLGSAGTLRENKSFVSEEEDFFIIYADNLTDYNLSEFYSFHKKSGKDFSMALFTTDTPKTKGIVQLDDNNTVISFEEKPQYPKSNLANAGLYIAKPKILELIANDKLVDIGFDLLPQLVNRMSAWEHKGFLMDIGTIEHLKSAEKEWKTKIKV